jgi:F-type H+-transporting ATPase subunit delta
MAAIDERSLGVARLYARAMLEVAEEQGAAESFSAELSEVVRLSNEDAEFERFLSSPVLDSDSRRRSLESALRGRASDLLVDSLQVVNSKGRLGLLEQVLAVYEEERRTLRGQIEVKVLSAVEMSEADREHLRERASAYTGKEAFLVEEVDPELLGGLVVQIGGEKVDVSVRRDLELLSSAYARRLSSEILAGREFATGSDSLESPDGEEKE